MSTKKHLMVVTPELMWKALDRFGIPQHIMNFIKALYGNKKSTGHINNALMSKNQKKMVIGNVDNEAKQLTIDHNTVESVNIFVYLSAQIHTNGESSMDIRRRITIAKCHEITWQNMEKP